MLIIEESSRRNDLFYYHEDVFVSEDSVWTGNTRHAAFTITEDRDGPHIGNAIPPKYRVNQRRELHPGVYIYERIFGADTVADAKQLIEEYINETVTQYIAKHKEFDRWGQLANWTQNPENPFTGHPWGSIIWSSERGGHKPTSRRSQTFLFSHHA